MKGFPVDVRAATEAPAASTVSFQCVDSVVHPKAHFPTRSLIRPAGSSLLLDHEFLAFSFSPAFSLVVRRCFLVSRILPSFLSLSSYFLPLLPSPSAILVSSSRSGAPVQAACARELSRPKAQRTWNSGKG